MRLPTGARSVILVFRIMHCRISKNRIALLTRSGHDALGNLSMMVVVVEQCMHLAPSQPAFVVDWEELIDLWAYSRSREPKDGWGHY